MEYEQHILARYPFPYAAHAWKGTGGNKRVYIQKEAILARLALIDPNYQFGRPEFLSEIDDVITVTGCLVLGGVEQWGTGTGVITRIRQKDGKQIEITGSDLATERVKAHKSAVTDLQARIPLLFGVGEYMKRIPQDSRSNEVKFQQWLQSITPDYPVPRGFVLAALISPFGELFQSPAARLDHNPDQQQPTPATPAPGVAWANERTVSDLFRMFRDKVANLDTAAMLWLASVDRQDKYDLWNLLYATGKAAGQAMEERYHENRPDVEAVWEATKKLYGGNRNHFTNSFNKHIGTKMMSTEQAVIALKERRQEAETEKQAG